MKQMPLVVSIDMGYGHLRAGYPLADALGTHVLHADREPLSDALEQRLWHRTRRVYESVSRLSQVAAIGGPLRRALEAATSIPHLYPFRDMSDATIPVRWLDRQIARKGLGRGLVEHLKRTGAPLLTTFYTPAVVADRAGCERVYCVVTDTDINRIWVAVNARDTRIRYLAPSRRVVSRLRAYGVPPERIRFTGFPLPGELLGGRDLPVLKRNLAARLVRLDPEGHFRRFSRAETEHFLGPLPEGEEKRPPLVTFTVGGAGAQAGLARQFLPGLARPLKDGRLRIALVAGVRREVETRFLEDLVEAGLRDELDRSVTILCEDDHDAYFPAFNALLAQTDVLWTKPSEMVFFGALGIPLLLSWPVGYHERYNRRWAIDRGAGIKQRDPRYAPDRILELLADGTLAAAAWSGFMRLPKFGLYEILDELESGG
jgi:hypothetical protein